MKRKVSSDHPEAQPDQARCKRSSSDSEQKATIQPHRRHHTGILTFETKLLEAINDSNAQRTFDLLSYPGVFKHLSSKTRETLLLQVIRHNWLAVFQLLLTYRIDVNAILSREEDNEGTVLSMPMFDWALSSGAYDIACALISHQGLDFERDSYYSWSPFSEFISNWEHIIFHQSLSDSRIGNITPQPSRATLLVLLDKFVEIRAFPSGNSQRDYRILTLLIEAGEPAALRRMLQLFPEGLQGIKVSFNAFSKSPRGETLLFQAVFCGQLDCVTMLLDEGADPQEVTNFRNDVTGTHVELLSNFNWPNALKLLQMFFKRGLLQPFGRYHRSESLVQQAIDAGRFEVVKYYLELCAAELDHYAERFYAQTQVSILHYVFRRMPRIHAPQKKDFLKYICNVFPGDVNVPGLNERLPLQDCNRDCKTVVILLRMGANYKALRFPTEEKQYFCFSGDRYGKENPGCFENCPVLEYFRKLRFLGHKPDEHFTRGSGFFNNREFHTMRDPGKLDRRCQQELERMRARTINCMTRATIYDVLFMDRHEVARYVKNEVLRATYEKCGRDFGKAYPCYGFILNRLFRAGLPRDRMIAKARERLWQATGMDLPRLCAEEIFKHLSDAEIKQFIGNTGE